MSATPNPWVDYKQAVLNARDDFSFVFNDLEGIKTSTNGWVTAKCPFHEDHNPSFAFEKSTGNWKCQAGCNSGSVFDYVAETRGLSFRDAMVALGDELGVQRPDVGQQATSGEARYYDYRDADGKLVYQVVKSPGKKFWSRRPGKNGNWVKGLRGVGRVLYRLPDLLARSDDPVYITEGEKDADALAVLGLVATTNPNGAGKWTVAYSDVLNGRDIVILPDNDDAGVAHAAQVAESCKGKAKSIRIIRLPGLEPKGDVSDWLAAGGDQEQLEALVAAGEFCSDQGRDTAPGRPSIQVNDRQQVDIFADAWQAILAGNDPPHLFTNSGHLARLADGEWGMSIELLDEAYAYGTLIRQADWVKVANDKKIDAKPPRELAKDILSRPHHDLPKIDSIVNTPVFAADGHLIREPGYYPGSRLWLETAAWMEKLHVPESPSDGEVADALQLLCQDLLVDFPFTAESDEAHALGALLLPPCRRLIDGPTPIHLTEAPTPGSGKGLFAEILSVITLGEPCAPTTLTRNDEECRKKLTALLGQGHPIIPIDNVEGGLESGQLAAAITAQRWKDRLLGTPKIVVYPNRALWIVTANNPKLSMEIARRCVRIRIEPEEERPWERVGFKHDPLRDWVQENRPALVRAILVLIQSWIAAGKPTEGVKVLGSFESWSRVIGGILRHVGVTEFLQDTESFYETADPESGQWRAFVEAWWEKHGSASVGVRDLVALAETNDLIAFAYAAKSEQSQRMRMGRALSAQRGRRFGDLQIVVGENSNRKVNMYRVVPVQSELLNLKEGP